MPVDAAHTFTQFCTAYATRMPAEHVFSHATAARLLELPLSLELERDTTLHVTAFDPARTPRMIGVVGHHLAAGAVRTVSRGGLRMTAPVDTWCSLATVLSLDNLIIVGDALVRRVGPLATMAELRQGVAGFDGRRGARRLRDALLSVRPRVDSPMETKIRLMLVRAGLPEPDANVAITNCFGAFIAFGDLTYPEYRILIEYDGGYHFGDERQIHKDIDRLDDVMEEGWRVIRINKSHLNREATVIGKVRTALVAAGWRP